VLPTVGGQTALNLAVQLHELGILQKYGVKLIGAQIDAIKVAEDRLLFRNAMEEIGVEVPKSGVAKTLEEALAIVDDRRLPGHHPPVVHAWAASAAASPTTSTSSRSWSRAGSSLSPVHEILVEESVIGWKEFELEVMRDVADNFVVICSIENIDPMGVHTGDSITVAPALTLTDKEYQRMRDLGRRIIRRVGVETGGSNIQFAVNPEDGRIVAIEMNPRVSRSSALASKATGFPIAKIAAKLALGYHLDEIPERHHAAHAGVVRADHRLHRGEVPALELREVPAGRPDADHADEVGGRGDGHRPHRSRKRSSRRCARSSTASAARSFRPARERPRPEEDDTALRKRLVVPTDKRMWALFRALQRGWTVETIHDLTKIDPWFLEQFRQIVELKNMAGLGEFREMSSDLLRTLKRAGFADADIALIYDVDESWCGSAGSTTAWCPPTSASTPARRSSSRSRRTCTAPSSRCARPTRPRRRRSSSSGSGPNRIGQGIEFDYCCCHAVFGFREEGFETVMVNCNPETVSTDYDTADRLYFEPLTFEDVMAIVERERSAGGSVACVVQFGGQTPLKLALALQEAGVEFSARRPTRSTWRKTASASRSCCGTSACRSRRAAPRCRVKRRGKWPTASATRWSCARPTCSGGRGMAIVFDQASLDRYMAGAVDVSHDRPVLIDKFLEDAFELDVDAVADSTAPSSSAASWSTSRRRASTRATARAWCRPSWWPSATCTPSATTRAASPARSKVVGLMNIQYAIKDDTVYVLEVNPRSSRTGALYLEGHRHADGEDRRRASPRAARSPS
jgi:carbamoyl-phosphate synthase large subunit